MSTSPETSTAATTPSGAPASSRRRLLAAGGLGGLLLAGTAATGTAAAASSASSSSDDRHEDGNVPTGVATVAALLRLETRRLAPNTIVVVAGYHAAGDGGGMVVRWDPRASLPVNGGTVLANPSPKREGRWIQVHDGVMDFRRFGILDDKVPADAALDAMVDDPYIHRIEAHTDLLFVKRHTFGRSRIVLDFGGHTVRTTGIEKNTHDNPFGAVLYFKGKVTDTVVKAKLSQPMPDLADVFEVPDSAAFKVGDWWAVTIDPEPGKGKYEQEVQRLVEITQLVDATHIRVGYKIGWDLAAGRTFTWTRIEPVDRAHVRNMVFQGIQDGDQYTGSHPIAYEYTIHCDVEHVDAVGTFWPVVMRRWCTHYRTRACSLKNPASVTWGGAGYLTQQIYCLYGHVEDCHVANSRHLNDLTASAYCYVTNCHGDGDDQGPFVTHGQFEHDLVYTGNSGLMTFANSGAAWGSVAKRITVRKHVCSWFVARVKITDLTLEDMQVIGKPALAGSGMLWVNADGVQIRGCTASGPLIVSQASNRSQRANVIADSTFTLGKDAEITQANVSGELHLHRVTLKGLDNASLKNAGRLVLTDCTLVGTPTAAPTTVTGPALSVSGGELRDSGLRFAGTGDQSVALARTRLGGTNATRALLSRTGGARTVSWQLDGCVSTAADPATAHVLVTDGPNRYRAAGSTFTGGRLELAGAAFGGNSALLHGGCVEDGVTRTALPDEGPRVAHTAGNQLL
ncbi:peptidase C14 [Embleya sp. NPDC050154]|uniref:peptidase C14 n=1 Tax=unclassified Embleya TaxID=2699296 RepID=UPI0037882F34